MKKIIFGIIIVGGFCIFCILTGCLYWEGDTEKPFVDLVSDVASYDFPQEKQTDNALQLECNFEPGIYDLIIGYGVTTFSKIQKIVISEK